jgi:hypothetical protein
MFREGSSTVPPMTASMGCLRLFWPYLPVFYRTLKAKADDPGVTDQRVPPPEPADVVDPC